MRRQKAGANSYKLLVKAAIRRSLGGGEATVIYKAAQTKRDGNGGWGEAGTDESADLMGLGWSTTGRPTATPPGAIGPFSHRTRGVAGAGCSPWPSGWPGCLQGQKREGGYRWGRAEHWILGLRGPGQSLRQVMGLRTKLRLRTCIVSGPRGEGEADSVAKHILIFHSLAGTCSCLRAAKAEDCCALGHTKYSAATVVWQPAEPELHSVPHVLVTVEREVVHIEVVETGLKEGRKRHRGCLVCIIYTQKIKRLFIFTWEKQVGIADNIND